MKEQKKLHMLLAKRLDLKRINDLFSKYLGPFSLWLMDKEIGDIEVIKQNLCKTALANKQNKEACLKNLEGTLKKTEKSKKIELFTCPFERHGFCLPLVTDAKEIFGHIIACHFLDKPGKDNLDPLSFDHL